MKDEAFIRGDRPMTKMEIRSTIIDYMNLEVGNRVLEIGAGTGSVSIQMKKLYPDIHLIAVEKTEEGCMLIKANAEKHGVAIEILHGEAPNVLNEQLGMFDRIYVGGTGRQLVELMTWLETYNMKTGTIIVFSVITIESVSEIFEFISRAGSRYHNLEASQVNASRLENLGSYHYFKPMNPCTVIKCEYGGRHV